MIFAFPALWLYLGLSSLSSYKQHGHEYLVKYIYMIFSRFLITAVSLAMFRALIPYLACVRGKAPSQTVFGAVCKRVLQIFLNTKFYNNSLFFF